MKRSGLRLSGGVVVALILAAAFIARWSIADKDSYWLDELLSVDTYGVGNKSLAAAIKKLATSSIHPPLYQLILYGWMTLFGDVERTTRTLSNVYVTAAGLCVYLAVRRPLGERRAVLSTLVFSFMYVPVKFALETRSYGQSLFLSTLSTWALFDWMRLLDQQHSFRNALGSRPALVLMAANFLMLMTHYYNVFFLTVQGAFVVAWTLRWSRAGALLRVVRAASALILPLALQLAVWGPVMAQSYQRNAEKFLATEALEGPFFAFWRYAIAPALREIPLVFPALLGVLALVFLAKQVLLARRTRREHPTGRATFIAYALTTSFGAFVVAWALFAASGHARYVDRYFAFTAPAIAVLLVCALEQLVAPLCGRTALARSYVRWPALYAVAALALILPSTYRVITKSKADWRGTAKQVVELVESDPSHEYAVFSSGFTTYPSLNYYFKRYGSKVRVASYFGRDTKKAFSPSARKKLAGKDFLVLTFTHLEASDYDKLLLDLDRRYELHKKQLHDGQGIVVYRIK
jgi:4-amino-4-deoxy-L-arabinose transferase-like glycosyltransferase